MTLCRLVGEDGGDVLNLVESDEELIFQDATPHHTASVTNNSTGEVVQIHHIPSSMLTLLVVNSLQHLYFEAQCFFF